MAVETAPDDSIRDDGQEALLSWSVCPARRRPAVALAVVVVLLLAASYAAVVMGTFLAGMVAAAFLIVVLRGYFFPTRYEIDRTGVTVRGLWRSQHWPWRRVRRFGHDTQGGFLSRRSRRGLLDSVSGMHLTWGENREQAVALIDSYRRRIDQEGEVSTGP